MMTETSPDNATDGYDCFRRLIKQLRDEHFGEAAERLDVLLNQTAWTTGSELIGELGLAIRDFLRTRPRLTPSLRKTLKDCKKTVRHAWGGDVLLLVNRYLLVGALHRIAFQLLLHHWNRWPTHGHYRPHTETD